MDADEGPTRERILAVVQRFPGIHFRGIVKELETSTALVRYHLQGLEEAGEVRHAEVGGFVRYFPVEAYGELDPADRRHLAVLRQERPLEIVLALLELGPMQHRDLHEVLGGSKGTLTYHLQKLEGAGLVRRVARGPERGFHLVDEAHVRHLLARFEPASDIVERVHDTWDDLFGGHRRGQDREGD